MSSKQFIPAIIIILVTIIAGYFLLAKSKNTSSVVVEIPFKEKQYKLNYSNGSYKYIKIVSFEEDENWQGDGRIDNDYVKEGYGSLVLSPADSQVASSYLEKKIDLESVNHLSLFLFLRGEPEDLEFVNLNFSDKNSKTKLNYPITLLQKGWNLVRIPREKFNIIVEKEKQESKTATKSSSPEVQLKEDQDIWTNIERISFDLKVRPSSKSSIYLDNLGGEFSQGYLEDWVTVNDQNLSLGEVDGNVHLRFLYINHPVSTLKKISTAKDYSFKATIYPQSRGQMGLFFRGNYSNARGYYFYIGGVGTNTWSITKFGPMGKKVDFSNLVQGEITNFSFEKNKPYGLKVTIKGSRMKAELATDNKNYSLLGEASDSSFTGGGVGISVKDNAVALFDDFEFNQ